MVTLVIMDGFGINRSAYGNAVKAQGTPNLNKLKKRFPYTEIEASGEFVGLTKGQMGNSEVGHLNLGAGRVVYQDLTRIDHDIETGEFYKNQTLLNAISHAVKNNSTLHLMGLCSDGGVHSHIKHLKTLIEMAENQGVKDICLHLFLDGRDTLFNSGSNFVKQIEEYIENKTVKICSLCGRVYAMDREKRFDRVKKAYDMLIYGKTEQQEKTITDAFSDSYSAGVYDEFFEPTKLTNFKAINDNDSVIFFNFRTDRARELTEAITQEGFKEFETKKFNNLCFTTFTEYDSSFKNINIAFPPEKIENNLSAILSRNGLKQLHITETTKYAHVTFFFNGGIEKEYDGEDRILIESENIKDFSTVPKMKAFEIADEVLRKICEQKYDFILVNLSNADMIGHTGNFDSSVTAIDAVDRCAYAIALATLAAGGHCIITADHGNSEQMLTKNGEKLTSHTTNPVPVILVSDKHRKVKLKKGGKLANIAPTVLKLLNLEIPFTMEQPLFDDE